MPRPSSPAHPSSSWGLTTGAWHDPQTPHQGRVCSFDSQVAQPLAQNGRKHCFTHAYTDHAAYIEPCLRSGPIQRIVLAAQSRSQWATSPVLSVPPLSGTLSTIFVRYSQYRTFPLVRRASSSRPYGSYACSQRRRSRCASVLTAVVHDGTGQAREAQLPSSSGSTSRAHPSPCRGRRLCSKGCGRGAWHRSPRGTRNRFRRGA